MEDIKVQQAATPSRSSTPTRDNRICARTSTAQGRRPRNALILARLERYLDDPRHQEPSVTLDRRDELQTEASPSAVADRKEIAKAFDTASPLSTSPTVRHATPTRRPHDRPTAPSTSETGRRWLYSIGTAAGAIAVGYGILTTEMAALWLGLLAALLGGVAVLHVGEAGVDVPRCAAADDYGYPDLPDETLADDEPLAIDAPDG